MGTIVKFPQDPAAGRSSPPMPASGQAMGQVVILPVIRIERHEDESNGRDPEEGAAARRRRRRRARS